MKLRPLRKLLIALFLLSPCLAFTQSSGRIYTDEDIEKIIQQEKENCPETKERILVQDQGSSGKISLMIAGGINYMHGAINDDPGLDSDLANWQGEVMLGYSYVTSKGGGSTLGVFGRVGNTSSDGLDKLNSDALINESLVADEQNLYYNIEGGVIIAEVLRISTGMGFQEYQSQTSDMNRAAYYSTTAGLHIGSKNFKLMIDANFMYGRDLQETIIRPNIGLGIRL